jgi:hypothetical protein
MWSTAEFKACLPLYYAMSSAASSFIIKEDSKNYKLAKVVSTKLSIEDENLLQQITVIAYKLGSIKEPTKSELVRLILTHALSSIKNESKKLSLLSQQYEKKNSG